MGRSKIFLLICLILLSFASSETQTNINVSNSPPMLVQNIPNILVIRNTPNINAFDLDDYFEDLNGDDILFTHSELNNVTITINSENQVSFYPDENYSGTQGMQFTASDMSASAASNIFQVTVGLDTEPPQWSNPKKNIISVYQNYHVTFSTEWIDNVGLASYIFSINQGTGWQNQTITEFSGTSNASAQKIQISASPGTEVHWTFYAKDIYDNMNVVDTQSFIVKEFIAQSGVEYDESKTYDGDTEYGEGIGSSSGDGDTKLDYFKEGILAENLEVDIRNLKISLKQGENMTRVVQIVNTGNVPSLLNATLKNLDFFATISEEDFVINPGETYELLIEFSIPEDAIPDQYFGFLLLDYGEKIYIPIVLDVKEFKSDLRIEVNVTKESKAVRKGEKVVATITIINMKDVSYSPSQLYYAIKNFRGNIIDSANEELQLPGSFSEKRTLIVPEGAPDGDYIFYARITSEDSIDLDSDKFQIGTKFKIIAILKKFFYPVVILTLLLILFLLYIIYKRNKKKKRLLELYLLLTELKTLVKKGETMKAMDVYKRIKLTYGQHVSKGFIENETKLREELDKFSKILAKTETKEKQEEKKEKEKTPQPKTEAPKPETTKIIQTTKNNPAPIKEKTLPKEDPKNNKAPAKKEPSPNPQIIKPAQPTNPKLKTQETSSASTQEIPKTQETPAPSTQEIKPETPSK